LRKLQKKQYHKSITESYLHKVAQRKAI